MDATHDYAALAGYTAGTNFCVQSGGTLASVFHMRASANLSNRRGPTGECGDKLFAPAAQ
ncbi:hypothetical protein BN2475_700084 [Paraburkholderia ribeironis]|uniref:Uncharacterized protein n=1 Tax=Paraburkholderia ribeironis TaxID=1247936 RepID=A0A1N7SHV9_9BURK|nr:hypothetical protein BN2475_700084 [Paraburkholderia ribeironis]